MNGNQVGLLIVVAVLLGLAGGAGLHREWLRRQHHRKRKIPRHWPMKARLLVNGDERKVWHWLQQAFFDHHVMVKLPLTRFTAPRDQQEGLTWFELLSGFYCTFTLCAPNGQVVGCVDVLGRNGITRSHRMVKETLLAQCGIAYWVVAPYALPEAAEIRTEFLGEAFARSAALQQDSATIATARSTLRSTLDRMRHDRPTESGGLVANSEASTSPTPLTASDGRSRHRIETESAFDSLASSGWQQRDSFIAPLDSRNSLLH